MSHVDIVSLTCFASVPFQQIIRKRESSSINIAPVFLFVFFLTSRESVVPLLVLNTVESAGGLHFLHLYTVGPKILACV